MIQLFRRRLVPTLTVLALIALTACDRPFLHSVPVAKPPSTCPDVAPTSPAVVLTPTGVELTWQQAAELDLEGFRVERWEEAEGWVNLIEVDGDTLAHTDATAEFDAVYSYRVRGMVDGCADLPTTAEVEIFTLPLPPTGMTISTQTQTSISLNLPDVSSTEASYRLERLSEDESSYVVVVDPLDIPGAVLGHSDDGLVADTCYTYQLSARRQGAEPGSEFELTSPDEVDGCTLPKDPTGLNVTAATSTTIHLAWSDTNRHLSQFYIYRFDDLCSSAGTTEDQSFGTSSLLMWDNGLSADSTYCYRVYATHLPSDGGQLFSPGYAEVEATTTGDAVTGLVASAQSETSIRLDWVNPNTNSTAFVVERSLYGQDSFTTLIDDLAPNLLFFSDSGLTGNTRYEYRVSVRNAGGESSPAAVDGWTLPYAPDSVTVAALSTSDLQISWTDTGNSTVDGYKIERSLAGAGSFALVTDFASPVLTHLDEFRATGTGYDYRIAAFVNGPAQILSAWTVGSGTTTHDPQLSWGAAPSIDASCVLTVPGVASFDSRASFESANAYIGGAAAGNMTADASGFGDEITDLSWGPLQTSWNVKDDMGGDALIERELRLVPASSRIVRLMDTATQRLGHLTGQQSWNPLSEPLLSTAFPGTCAICDGLRGSLARGHHFGCALDRSGELRCWGSNSAGQLGNGGSGILEMFGPVCDNGCSGGVPVSGVRQIATGYAHSCAVNDDGEPFCWGADGTNQLGRNDSVGAASAVPLPVYNSGAGGELSDVVAIAVAGYDGVGHSCAINESDETFCWGDNRHGQLGVNLADAERGFATKIATFQESVAVALGAIGGVTPAAHGCLLSNVGAVSCWGSDDDGQMGNGSTGSLGLPHAVCTDEACTASLNNVYAIAAGGAHSCALLDSGQVQCWGRNISGQIGDGETGSGNNRTVPSTVCATGSASTACTALDGIAAITAGGTHTCALKESDGSIWCWGGNDSKQLGNGDVASEANPVPVCIGGSTAGADCAPLVTAVAVAAGSASTCALLASRQVLCWGYNYDDVLGNSSSDAPSATPLLVCSSDSAVECAGGAIYSDAAVRACGPVEVLVP